MNILIVIADQLSFRGVRAYGGTQALPTIDSLFQRGTALEQAYTSCPLCLPARASFWTSRYPHRTGALSNGRAFTNATVSEDTPSLGSLFSSADWECVHFGKEHDAGALHGFTRMPTGEIIVEPEPGYPVNTDTFRDRFTVSQVQDWFANRAKGSKERQKPLLAVVDLLNPHNICGWVGEMARHVLGPDAEVVPPGLRNSAWEPVPGFPPQTAARELPPLPPNFRDIDFETRPKSVQYQCCAHNRLAQTQGWGEREFQLYLDAYNHYTRLLDTEIARVLAAAEGALDMDETYVVFTSDHGDAIAAHSGATKHTTLYEETTRVPFAIVGPGVHAGETVSGPTSLLDLVPTLCDLAGLTEHPQVRKASEGMDGISLAQAVRGTTDGDRDSLRYVVSEWHTEWGFTIEPGRMITDGRYKLMRYVEGNDEEFYDLRRDPYETKNLIPSLRNSSPSDDLAALQRLRAALETHIVETNDPFPTLEAYAPPAWRSHPAGYHNHRGIAAPAQAP